MANDVEVKVTDYTESGKANRGRLIVRSVWTGNSGYNRRVKIIIGKEEVEVCAADLSAAIESAIR